MKEGGSNVVIVKERVSLLKSGLTGADFIKTISLDLTTISKATSQAVEQKLALGSYVRECVSE